MSLNYINSLCRMVMFWFLGKSRDPSVDQNQVQVHLIIDMVDNYHVNGRTITNREVRNMVMLDHKIKLSKMTISNYFKRCGLNYKRVNNKGRSVGAYCKDLLQTFLIELDKYHVIVGMEKSYIHCCRHSKGCPQGRRLGCF
jgi:hypothetical protein